MASFKSHCPEIISPNPFDLLSKPTYLLNTVGLLKSPSIKSTVLDFSKDNERLKAKVVFPSDGFDDVIKKLLFL